MTHLINATERGNEGLFSFLHLPLGDLPILVEFAPFDNFCPQFCLLEFIVSQESSVIGERVFHLFERIRCSRLITATKIKGLTLLESNKSDRGKRQDDGAQQETARSC